MVKKLPTVQETLVRFLGWEDPLEEGMATHSSILNWRIPMNRGSWQATVPWGHKDMDMTESLSTAQFIRTYEYMKCIAKLYRKKSTQCYSN